MKTGSQVISIRRPATKSKAAEEIADLAFHLWVSAAFRGASPEEALAAAEQMLQARKRRALFLVPGRDGGDTEGCSV